MRNTKAGYAYAETLGVSGTVGPNTVLPGSKDVFDALTSEANLETGKHNLLTIYGGKSESLLSFLKADVATLQIARLTCPDGRGDNNYPPDSVLNVDSNGNIKFPFANRYRERKTRIDDVVDSIRQHSEAYGFLGLIVVEFDDSDALEDEVDEAVAELVGDPQAPSVWGIYSGQEFQDSFIYAYGLETPGLVGRFTTRVAISDSGHVGSTEDILGPVETQTEDYPEEPHNLEDENIADEDEADTGPAPAAEIFVETPTGHIRL